MSLIVARKDASKVYIVSDTKLTAPEGHNFNKGHHITSGENIIKTTIINHLHCISFAGNVLFAEQALQKVSDVSTAEKMEEILLTSHTESAGATEYILAYVNSGSPRIVEIKSGFCREVETSWIGSQQAFNNFQRNILGQNPNPQRRNFLTVTKADSGELMHNMINAIDEVIQDEEIPEVAGFKVKVYFDGKRFIYDGYLDTYFTAQQMNFNIPPGQTSFRIPITHANAAQGGYTVNFFDSRENYNHVGLHVKQGDFGILYSRENGGLLQPRLLENMDEIDFMDYVKNYQLFTNGATQDAFRKFGIDAKNLFDKGDYDGAYAIYTRGIAHLFRKEKGLFYFNRAICLIYLKRIPEVLTDFNEAVKYNPECQADASRIMLDVINKKR